MKQNLQISPLREVAVICALIIHIVAIVGAIALQTETGVAALVILTAFIFWAMGVEENGES